MLMPQLIFFALKFITHWSSWILFTLQFLWLLYGSLLFSRITLLHITNIAPSTNATFTLVTFYIPRFGLTPLHANMSKHFTYKPLLACLPFFGYFFKTLILVKACFIFQWVLETHSNFSTTFKHRKICCVSIDIHALNSSNSKNQQKLSPCQTS